MKAPSTQRLLQYFRWARTRGGKPNIARCGMNGSARVKERELVYDMSGIAELGVASFPMVAAQAAKLKNPCHALLS